MRGGVVEYLAVRLIALGLVAHHHAVEIVLHLESFLAELLGDETINAIAEVHNVTAAQVILRWNLQRNVIVIPGSSNPDHIRENLDLFGFKLSDKEMEQIKALNRDEKHDWY